MMCMMMVVSARIVGVVNWWRKIWRDLGLICVHMCAFMFCFWFWYVFWVSFISCVVPMLRYTGRTHLFIRMIFLEGDLQGKHSFVLSSLSFFFFFFFLVMSEMCLWCWCVMHACMQCDIAQKLWNGRCLYVDLEGITLSIISLFFSFFLFVNCLARLFC